MFVFKMIHFPFLKNERKVKLSQWANICSCELWESVLVLEQCQHLIHFCVWIYWHWKLCIWCIKCLAHDLAEENNEYIDEA